MCDFFISLDDSFAVVCMGFHKGCDFNQICKRKCYNVHFAKKIGTKQGLSLSQPAKSSLAQKASQARN